MVLNLGPTIVRGDVLTLDKAYLIETLADDSNERRVDSRRTAAEQSITGIARCCARAAIGQAAVPLSMNMNSRRRMKIAM